MAMALAMMNDSVIEVGEGHGNNLTGATNFSDIGFENSGENGEVPWEEVFRDLSRFWVQRFFVPIVVCIGVLGNIITIYILTRRPMRCSTNV